MTTNVRGFVLLSEVVKKIIDPVNLEKDYPFWVRKHIFA
jgi:hypothetical protein